MGCFFGGGKVGLGHLKKPTAAAKRIPDVMYADEDDKGRHSESQQMLQQDLDADADKNDTARDFGLFPVFIAGPAADLNPG